MSRVIPAGTISVDWVNHRLERARRRSALCHRVQRARDENRAILKCLGQISSRCWRDSLTRFAEESRKQSCETEPSRALKELFYRGGKNRSNPPQSFPACLLIGRATADTFYLSVEVVHNTGRLSCRATARRTRARLARGWSPASSGRLERKEVIACVVRTRGGSPNGSRRVPVGQPHA